MKNKIIFCVLVLIIAIPVLVGCNSAQDSNPSTTTSVDTTAKPPVDTVVQPPTVLPQADTVQKRDSKPESISKKTAELGYSYFSKMKRGDTKFIRAFVSINNPTSKIRDTLRQIEKIQTVENFEEDSSNINIINNIPFYKKIRILIDSTTDFFVKAYKPSQQEIDTLNGNLWVWQVTARTDKKVADITLLVDAATPQGVLENIDIREIKIKIEIDKVTFVRAAINYLGDNPKVSIPILVGFIGFIGWLIKYFLEKKKGDDSKKA